MNIAQKCHLGWLTQNSTIKQRIWFGFGLLLLILAVVSMSTLSQFTALSSGINKVTDKIQPAVLSSQTLAFHLESANNALGFYMLTREPQYKDKYFRSMDESKTVLTSLQSENYIATNEGYRSKIQQIANYIEQLSSYKDRVVELVTNDVLNFPAMQIAGEKLNPMARQMQSMISQMIISEWEEENYQDSRSEFRQALYDIRYYNVQLLSELRTFLAFRSENNITNLDSMNEVLDARIAALAENEEMLTFEQAEIIPEYQKIREDYKQALNEASTIHSSEKYRRDIYLTKSEIGPTIVKSQAQLVELVNLLRDDIAQQSSALQNDASAASSEVITGMTLGIIIGVIIAFFMLRMITIPINEAVIAIEDLAEGEGDLTKRLRAEGKSEIMQMSDGFNRFASKVQKLVTQVADGVQNLSLVVKDLSSIVDQTQQGSQQQRAQTEQVASAITAMTTTAEEVSSNANLAAESAQQADKNSKTGQSVVINTIDSINELASEIETGVNVINELEKDVEAIGSVLDVIRGISEQTNLLALNAAIEAARAGEQGRGFAVVADEVRTLASRTQESTTEIQKMINNLQAQASAAVHAITQGRDKARTSVTNASNAGDALNAITQSVATITSMNIQIARASDEQTSMAAEINQNIVNISQVAEQNASASESLSESSNNLALLAEELKGVVSQFKY